MNLTAIIAKRPWAWGLALLIFILLAALPLYGSEYTVILVTAIIMYVALTVSWVMFSGPTGNISLAPAAFLGLGIYTSAVMGRVLPLPLVIVAGALASLGLALVVGALTLRLRGIYFSIFTFGLVVLIQQLILWYEVRLKHTRGRFVIVIDNQVIFYVMLTILAALLLTAYLIRESKYGLALKCIGEDDEAAAHAGVNVTALKTILFGLSAFFMGATGAIMATKWTYIDPYIAFNPLFSFMPVLMAIFGGLGTFYGPILGAAVFAYLEELLITQFPYQYMLIFGIILVVAILYLPGGLAGLAQQWMKGGPTRRHGHS
ncbi:MAG: branched-chain amino acid ABC transporter permease [Deltaproteobacteria bacterium]|nr:branched-chain amino acid ABC transporter permease [Deltaproteobacteria bacterium]